MADRPAVRSRSFARAALLAGFFLLAMPGLAAGEDEGAATTAEPAIAWNALTPEQRQMLSPVEAE